jgi:uncharacterized protein
MSISLRDQLLKAGLVNEKQAKQAGKEKQKQQRLAHKGQIELDDTQQRLAAEAKAEKIKRDQELNRQQQEKAEQKARAAQIKQLIEVSRLPKLSTEDYYNFVDDKKVKRLSVNTLMRNKLANVRWRSCSTRGLRSHPARSRSEDSGTRPAPDRAAEHSG